MATVKKIPLGRKPGEAKVVLPDVVTVELTHLVGKVKQGLLAFSVGVGLEVIHTLLDEDVTTIVGERGKWNPDRIATRHGAEKSSMVLGGRRVAVDKPRARSVAGTEVAAKQFRKVKGYREHRGDRLREARRGNPRPHGRVLLRQSGGRGEKGAQPEGQAGRLAHQGTDRLP